MAYELEKSFRVYDTFEQPVVCIEVKPNTDNPEGYLTISTSDVEYYGELNLTLPNEQAKLLAKAILELVGE